MLRVPSQSLKRLRRAAMLAVLPLVLAGPAFAQNVITTPGDFDPSYNVDTSTPTGNFDTGAFQTQVETIMNDDALSESEKETAINDLSSNAVSGGFGSCAQQFDDLLLGLDAASVGVELAGTIAEAVGALFIVSEIPGVILQGIGTGLHLAGTVTTGFQNAAPNCNAEFTGTVEAWSNIAAKQGISAFAGKINLGNPDGVSYSQGIELGGGSLSGAGSEGPQASTGDATAVAIGNGAVAQNANDTAIGTGA